MTAKLKWRKYATLKWKNQAGNFTTNMEAKINFCLPEFSAAKIVT